MRPAPHPARKRTERKSSNRNFNFRIVIQSATKQKGRSCAVADGGQVPPLPVGCYTALPLNTLDIYPVIIDNVIRQAKAWHD